MFENTRNQPKDQNLSNPKKPNQRTIAHTYLIEHIKHFRHLPGALRERLARAENRRVLLHRLLQCQAHGRRREAPGPAEAQPVESRQTLFAAALGQRRVWRAALQSFKFSQKRLKIWKKSLK